MKTPPLLLGATLLFWGWQTDFLIHGAIMAVVLEGSRFVKLRWDLSDEDFKRIWTFCALLFLAAAVYAFADSGGPEGIGHLFQSPNPNSEREAGVASARTATALVRWLPMVFILFISAQAFSSRQDIPLHTISLILRRRWKRAKKLGLPPPPVRGVDVTYPYFAICLFAASAHRNENDNFFWGLSALLGWALWLQRPRRFSVAIWAGALALAVVLGYSGARGMGVVQQYVDNLNVQWLAALFNRNQSDASQSRTQIGQIGRIKTSTKIMMRLTPKSGEPPSYLREASYRTYRSPVWSADKSRTDFSPIPPALTNENTWPLQPDKTNASRIGIACYLDGRERKTGNPLGLLPLPSGSARLESLPAYTLRQNSAGAVLVEGPGLLQFDALYGPGLTIDSPPETNAVPRANATTQAETDTAIAIRYDLETHSKQNDANLMPGIDLGVPTNEIPALEKVISELNLRAQSREKALQTVSEFFATKFNYRTWQDAGPQVNENETALGRFLLRTRAGHCEHFATATVLLLREIGIAARYAVGYSVHEAAWNGYVVRQRDAHAWCIVWNDEKKLWEDFDTTPGSWIEAESHNTAGLWFSDAWSWVQFQFAKFRWGQTHLREYILLGLVPVLALLFIQIIRQRRKRNSSKATTEPLVIWPGLDSEFYQIEKQLTQRGVLRGINEPLADWLENAAAEPSLAKLRPCLRSLLRLHYRYRFDPEGLGETDRAELRQEARGCLEKLSRAEQPPATASRASLR